MRWLSLTGLLTGCQLVFTLDDPATPDVVAPRSVCAGNGTNPLLSSADCVTSPRARLETGPAIVTGNVDDPLDRGDCDHILVQGDVDRTELCVIAADSVTVGNTSVVGPRPLAVFAVDDLIVTGTLSVATRGDAAGAGADFRTCVFALDGTSSSTSGGAGGGAGGSFADLGGKGGFGGDGSTPNHASGGMPMVETAALAFVRGGCPAGIGGTGTLLAAAGGAAGRSGGAMYLVAGGTIRIAGTLDAAGEGGGGGERGDNSPVAGGGGGGGGGGSGGLIALDAPAIELANGSKLVANGGGGGGGGGVTTNGLAGAIADLSTSPFSAPGGQGSGAGDGGDGVHAGIDPTTVPGHDVQVAGLIGGGGGGGGSMGFILLFGTVTNDGAQTSPTIE